MAVRITHTNNSSNHDGTYVYRSTSTMDPANLPAPIADAPPVALGATFEYIDSDNLSGGQYYRTQDHEGGQVSAVSAEVMITVAEDYSSAQVGDEIGGGIYAGTHTINSTSYHIIAGKSASEVVGVFWQDSNTLINADDEFDGLQNIATMEAVGINSFPAAKHCLDYISGGNGDWYMPAKAELGFVYTQLSAHPEFADNVASGNPTLTSTEHNNERAIGVNFSTGGIQEPVKNDSLFAAPYHTRPIRRVAV